MHHPTTSNLLSPYPMIEDNRRALFDELGDLIVRIDPGVSGPPVGDLGTQGLALLDQIELILRESEAAGKYEHGLQRGSDVREALESLINDYRVSVNGLESMRRDYVYMRAHSHAGSYPGLGM